MPATKVDSEIDIGLNWYWSFCTKIMLDWHHATYNKLTNGAGKRMGTISTATIAQ